MLILANATDAIEIQLLAAHTTNPLQCVASYRDITSTDFAPGSSLVNTNGVTAVDLVTGPAASTQRVIDFISVYNNDTVNHTVTLKYDANGTEYKIAVLSISPGERIQYTEGTGFQTFNTAGALKTIIAGTQNVVSTGWSTNVLGADVINNNAVANSIADVTGLSFPVVANQRYRFRFDITYTAAATATGSRWSINGPAVNALGLMYNSEYSLSSTTRTYNEGNVAYDFPALSNASTPNTAGVPGRARIEGFIHPSVDGTVIARFASEVASSAITAKRGSIVDYIAV